MTLTYRRLGRFVGILGRCLDVPQTVGIFGSPGIAMAARAATCVIHGRPLAHLDPAMSQIVLHDIVFELPVSLMFTYEDVATSHLPNDCRIIDAIAQLNEGFAPKTPLRAACRHRSPIMLWRPPAQRGGPSVFFSPRTRPIRRTNGAMNSLNWR